ncbi:hypothetical protein [Gottschalkia acidurici]|uniref:hypothetical protein n=1 Tax=Clostridium acidurici TaxID=1556 RepID=UPI001650D8EC|nr:hypothetical protein [Gottschalkia acidurici]
MKSLNPMFKKILRTICSFLILMVPLITTYVNCLGLWGEPEYPDLLKNSFSNK